MIKIKNPVLNLDLDFLCELERNVLELEKSMLFLVEATGECSQDNVYIDEAISDMRRLVDTCKPVLEEAIFKLRIEENRKKVKGTGKVRRSMSDAAADYSVPIYDS